MIFVNLETTEKNKLVKYGIRIESIAIWKIKSELLYLYVFGVSEPIVFWVSESADLIERVKKEFVNLKTTEKNKVVEYGIRIDFITIWKTTSELLYLYVAGVQEPVAFYIEESADLIAALKEYGIKILNRS
jgi:hypothetical protein